MMQFQVMTAWQPCRLAAWLHGSIQTRGSFWDATVVFPTSVKPAPVVPILCANTVCQYRVPIVPMLCQNITCCILNCRQINLLYLQTGEGSAALNSTALSGKGSARHGRP